MSELASYRPETTAIIVVDIGNTRLKWAELASSQTEKSNESSVAKHWVGRGDHQHERIVNEVTNAADRIWAISRVNDQVYDGLLSSIRHKFPSNQILELDRSTLPISVKTDQPQKVGMDRLLGAIAAKLRRPDSSAAITVDFGTATTVNALSAEGEFIGGAILPGIQTQFDALGHFTEKIPTYTWLPEHSTVPEAIGRNTESAVKSGVILGHIGAVHSLVQQFRKELGASTPCYVTGGGRPTLENFQELEIEAVPFLVLEGIIATLNHLYPTWQLPMQIESN